MSKSLFTAICMLIIMLNSDPLHSKESTCYGSTKKGRLEQGVKLPEKGNNFVSYSLLAGILGRTYVHSKVRDVILDAYRLLDNEQPNKVYKYAESGFREGGEFRPHKTHQNGLSVDFVVPVLDANYNSVHLPTNAFNKYGYAVDFDADGHYESLHIDFDALGAHIVMLHKSASNHDIDIWRVLFDPRLQPKLYATKYGSYIKEHITIPEKQSWVRHDDHYHVDFDVPCKPLE